MRIELLKTVFSNPVNGKKKNFLSYSAQNGNGVKLRKEGGV